MNRLLRLLQWLLKAAIFFTLFAFALNNQQDTRVNFFFGTHWQAPTVLVVLTAFALGVAVGVLGMVGGIVGTIACLIGVFVATAYLTAVAGHLVGQAYTKAKANMPAA